MKTVLSNLNLTVSKKIKSEMEALFLQDKLMIEDMLLTVKTIDGKLVQLNVLDWVNGETEIFN